VWTVSEERKDDQEPNFEIIDRRTSAGGGEEPTPEQPERSQAEPEAPPSAESGEQPREEAPPPAEEPAAEAVAMTAEDIITMSIGLLQQQAWVHMGLVMNPATKAVAKDMEQAKLAIDAVVALINLIAPRLDEQAQRELRAVVSDLQVNFVQQQ
jgi:hypothetical protein